MAAPPGSGTSSDAVSVVIDGKSEDVERGPFIPKQPKQSAFVCFVAYVFC